MGNKNTSIEVKGNNIFISIVDSDGTIIAQNNKIHITSDNAVDMAINALKNIKRLLGYDHCYKDGGPTSIQVIRMMINMDVEDAVDDISEDAAYDIS